MNRSLLSLTLALALAVAGPRVAMAAPAEQGPARATLKIDATALGDEAAGVKKRLETRCTEALHKAEVLPGKTTTDPVLRVELAPAGEDGAGFKAKLMLVRQGAIDEASLHEIACELCTEGELTEKIVAAIGDIVPAINEAPAVAEPVPTTQLAEPEPEEPEVAKPAPIGTLGGTGIALGVAGLAAIGIGAGLAAKKDQFVKGGSIKSTHPAGYSLLGIGGALLITGVALFVVDRVRAKKKPSRAAVLPYVGPGGAGLWAEMRF